MFKRHHIHFTEKTRKGSEPPGIRYLYCGLTGARFARSSKSRRKDDTQTPHQPVPSTSTWYNLLRPGPPAQTPEEPPSQPPENEMVPPQDSTPEQTIARLTAERDSACSERELEADYREALLRNIEVVSHQLNETQRRLMKLERAAQPAAQPSEGLDQSPEPGERERRLERELNEALERIAQLESAAALMPPAPLARGQEGMMDAFLQFVGLQDRHDDSRT